MIINRELVKREFENNTMHTIRFYILKIGSLKKQSDQSDYLDGHLQYLEKNHHIAAVLPSLSFSFNLICPQNIVYSDDDIKLYKQANLILYFIIGHTVWAWLHS